MTTYDNDPDEKEKVEDEKDEDRNLLKRFLLNTKNLSKPLCYQYDVGLSVLHKGTALYRGLFCLIFLIDELSHHPDHFVERWQAWTENFIFFFFLFSIIFSFLVTKVLSLTPAKHQKMFVFDGSERQRKLNLEEQIETCREC